MPTYKIISPVGTVLARITAATKREAISIALSGEAKIYRHNGGVKAERVDERAEAREAEECAQIMRDYYAKGGY